MRVFDWIKFFSLEIPIFGESLSCYPIWAGLLIGYFFLGGGGVGGGSNPKMLETRVSDRTICFCL